MTRLFMVDPDSMSASCLGKAIAFALVIVIASFARWSLDYSIVKVARYGVAQPYSVLNVDDYFERLIRDRLEEGCTLVFASSRAAWSALVYAFPFGYFDDPVRFYARSLDGLRTRDGAVVVTYSVPAEDAGQISPSLPDSLHIKRGQHGPAVNLNVVRFDYGDGGRACNEIYYLGHVDIPEREQRL